MIAQAAQGEALSAGVPLGLLP